MDKPTTLKMDQFKRIQGAIMVIANKQYPIFKGTNTVGRNKIAVVNIKHLNVSQYQALIILIDETQHYISDLNSSNGTFLQNTKLVPFKLYELMNNTEIKFGDVVAVYTKIVASDTTINLQETLDTNEMTQNMTQNFYASNTQLMDNNKYGNDSIASKPSCNPISIHEVQTQVINYPSVLPKPHNEPSSQLHDVPTQVCSFPKQPAIEINIHDAPTQVVDYSNVTNSHGSENKTKSSENKFTDSNTQIMTMEEIESISKRVDAGKSEILLVEDTNDSVISEKHSQEIPQNVEGLTKNKKNVIHYSQEPSTSGMGTSSKEYDESFSNASKPNDIIVEESIIENNLISEDSIDFLDLENTQYETGENNKSLTSPVNSDTSGESDIISKSKKPVVKLPCTQIDDETDIECTQDVLKKTVKPTPKLPDSQTDTESCDTNSQDIGFKKKPLKPILEESDTEPNIQEPLTEKPQNGEKTVNSDSDTDCEEVVTRNISGKKTTSVGDVSDSDTDVEVNKKSDLDDTDCIPPTQDAFANALGYKPMKCSQLSTNQSSEESFKLGLTELMSFTQTNSEKVELPKVINDEVAESNLSKIYDKETKENAIISNQQEELVKKFVFKKKSANLDNSLTTILSNFNRIENIEIVNADENVTENCLPPTENIDEDVFLQPTQLLTEKETDDIFLQPTQSLLKKVTDDYIFLKPNAVQQPSQKIDDDIFSQPTQLLGLKPDVYQGSLKPTDSCTQDIYSAATQIIQEQPDTISKDISMTQEDLYGQATQKIENIPDLPTDFTNQQEKDEYMLPTQQVTDAGTEATETQLELQYLDETIPIPVETDRPANPLLRELDKNLSQKECNEKQSTATEEGTTIKNSQLDMDSNTNNDKGKIGEVQAEKLNSSIETLSQIEEFLKKPLPPRKSVRHLKSKEESTSTLNDKKKTIKHEDRPETLSQIVAFVNEPVPKQERDKYQIKKSKEMKISTSGKALSEPPKQQNVSKQFSSESLEDSEDEIEKKDSSRETRSDIDQSFALLESKTSKIRRKVNNDSVLKEIKVMVTAHRNSMSIAENDKKPDLVVPLKKSKRTTLNNSSNIEEATVPAKINRTRKSSKLQSTIDEKTHTSYKSTTSNNNGSNSNTTKAPIETTHRVSKPESLPEDSKLIKLNTTREKDKITKRRKSKESVETDSVAGNSRISRSSRLKLSSVSEDVKNDISATITEKKRKNEPAKRNTEESSEDDLRITNTKSNITKKRNIIDSSEDTSDSPTPAKYTRTSRKISCITSDDNSSNNSSETSRSSVFTTPKKSRNSVKIEASTSSVERSKRKLKPKVAFTMLDSPKLESYIKHLGGSIVDTVNSATVLMTQNVKRSQKLLTAIAQGKPICPPDWINDSIKKSEFLDPWDYILVDQEAEEKWKFSLKESLMKAEKQKLLAGYFFQLMTQTATDVLKGAIEASGGKCVTKLVNKNLLDKFIIVASLENKAKYNRIKKQHPEIMVIEPEAIFDGVLRQELRFSNHVLA